MDYVILFILYTLIYTQGKSPYVSAFAFALLVFGANYYKKKQTVLHLHSYQLVQCKARLRTKKM